MITRVRFILWEPSVEDMAAIHLVDAEISQWMTDNFDLLVVLEGQVGITKVGFILLGPGMFQHCSQQFIL